jgi:hypothetical protein
MATVTFTGITSRSRLPREYCRNGSKPESHTKTDAPRKAPKMAEIPNCIRMDFSANRPRRASFNTLFKKCTMAVRATANSTGKNMAKTGISSVPNPKPENSVNAAAAAEAILIMR